MFWSIAIYGVFVLQLIAWGVLGFFLYKFAKGPVSRLIRRGLKTVRLGTRLGKSGMTILARNLRQGEELVTEVKGVAQGIKYGTRTDFGDLISYQSLFGLWLSSRSALGSLMGAWVFLSGLRKKDVPASVATGRPVKPSRPPRRSLADRMGLLPPAAQYLGRFYNYGRIAWDIRNELKRRGISPF